MIGPEWLFEPFTRVAFDTVGVWYLGTMAVMMTLAGVLHYFGHESDSPFPDGWALWQKLGAAVVIAPILEEAVFRIAPTYLFGGLTVVLAASVVWALLHGDSALVVAVTIPIYVKLALGGFFLEAILLHALHNTWATTVTHYSNEWGVVDDGEPELGERDLEDIDDDKELLDEVLHRMQHDDDFDPSVQINGTTYDSFGDVPMEEVEQYLDD